MRWAAVAVLLLLAGCFGGGSDDGGKAADPSQGFVRGVVVDGALRPVEGATVEVGVADRVTVTGMHGVFTIGPLALGSYPVAVGKVGYVGSQFTADAIPEGATAPFLKVVLERLASALPYVEAFVFEGYIECGTSSVAVCAVPNFAALAVCDAGGPCAGNVTGDRFTSTHVPEGVPDWVQSELVWTSTIAASDQFYFSLGHYTVGEESELETLYNSSTGRSPLLVTVPGQAAKESGLGLTEGLRQSVFPAAIEGTTPPGCAPPCVGPGVSVQQRFTVYTHFFYHYQPPAGWRFTEADVPLPPLRGA